jgi:predicted nucleic acid-binding protein
VIVLDTTVLVYAVGDSRGFREPCQRIIEAVQNDEIQATTTVEVIQEFAHVRARRRDRADAAELARAYLDLLEPLLIVAERDLTEGLRLFERHPRLGSFDAVLAAAARAADARALVSADAAYSAIPQLAHVIPDNTGVAKLLAG